MRDHGGHAWPRSGGVFPSFDARLDALLRRSVPWRQPCLNG